MKQNIVGTIKCPKNIDCHKIDCFLPYMNRVTDRMAEILRTHKETVFKALFKISQILPTPIDEFSPLSSNGVYKSPFS